MKKALLIVLILIFSLFPVMADNIQIAEEQAEGFVTSVIYTMGGIFDLIYQAFNEQFNMSFANLQVNFLPSFLMWLVFFELLWVCVQGILQKDLGAAELFMKLFLTVLIITIVTNLQEIIYGVRLVFSWAGIQAGNLDSSLYIESNKVTIGGTPYGYGIAPSLVARATVETFKPLEQMIATINLYLETLQVGLFGIGWGSDVSLPTYISTSLPYWLAIAGCRIVEFILFVILAFVNLNVMLWLIEFGFLLVVATICLPFQIFTPTKFMAHGLWQTLFGQCIKIFCILFLVGIAQPLFTYITEEAFGPIYDVLESVPTKASGAIDPDEFQLPASVIMRGIIITVCITITYCYFLMKGPSIAFAILSGTPTMETLGTHSVTRMGATAIGAGGTVLAAGLGALGGAAGAIFGRAGGAVGGVFKKIGDIVRKIPHPNPTSQDVSGTSSDISSHKFNAEKFQDSGTPEE